MTGYSVVIFHTTSAALRSEKVLKQAGIEIKLIPVPRQLSSDCGISVRFARDLTAKVSQALVDAHIDMVGIYEIE